MYLTIKINGNPRPRYLAFYSIDDEDCCTYFSVFVRHQVLWAQLFEDIWAEALLNLNIHTSYFSHAVSYLHEYVTFWYVWNIRTTNFEILIGTSFSQMFNFSRVKNSHVFVTPVNNSFYFFTYVRSLHTCDRFVRMWKSNESVTSAKNRT